MNTINMFYDQLMIDEFQDFREYDYDLMTTLSKYVNNILLVGDYYQHSVSAINNSFKKERSSSSNSLNASNRVLSISIQRFTLLPSVNARK